MSVVCKMFIQSKSESPSSCSYQLGAVCRGEENKHWAAATPSGSMKVPASDLLDEVWAARDATAPEVYVTVTPDAEGEWTMESCEFSYGGCAVKYRRKGYTGELSLTVNATPATKVLRDAFARSLDDGKPATFTVWASTVDA